MEGNKRNMLSWHVADVSVDKEVEEGLLKGVALTLQIRMPSGVLGRAQVALTKSGETVTERNLLLPGDMRMPAFAGMNEAKEQEARLVNAQVFLPAEREEVPEEGGSTVGIKICLFDGEDVCREGLCCPII